MAMDSVEELLDAYAVPDQGSSSREEDMEVYLPVELNGLLLSGIIYKWSARPRPALCCSRSAHQSIQTLTVKKSLTPTGFTV